MEKFIKIDNNFYYESELILMSTKQLNDLIKICQERIDEIEYKKNDYKITNYESKDMEHYTEVINKFETASIYFQSDIVLLSNIIKSKKNAMSICEKNDWYEEFFKVSQSVVSKRKLKKINNITNSKLGYSIL